MLSNIWPRSRVPPQPDISSVLCDLPRPTYDLRPHSFLTQQRVEDPKMVCQELKQAVMWVTVLVQSWNVFFPFFFFWDWKLHYYDAHTLVWLCVSWCTTSLYQTHLRTRCAPGSTLSALCGLLTLIITFQGKYFHHQIEKARLREITVLVSCMAWIWTPPCLLQGLPDPFH